ncbi:Polyadenylate-binding protein 1 [Carex littledalei]|uniref:Polyadenylate-binding protein 1 n=1 Tax=Carex littledalei TaxID=544730 RepID=A0A833RHK0_9POAL|nr:Polyadenylate-binding protein 1 [Carex littledalei]
MTEFEERFEENIEEEPIEIEPEEEPIEIEPEEEPIEIEPEEEPIEIEPEEEPIEIEPEEEPIEIEPEEEPIEIEPEEEPIEIEPEEEPIEIEPEEVPFEIEPEEETVGLKPIDIEKGLSNETVEEPFEVPNKELLPDKQEYQRTLTKPANRENLKAGKRRRLQDLDKNYVSRSSVLLDKNQGRVWYKQDRLGLSQTGWSKGEIDMTNLYVCNFPQSLNDEDLKKLFVKFGPIAKIYVAMDNDSGLNNGYGFVKFTNAAHAAMAIDQMNGYTIMGMPMQVNIKGARSETGTFLRGLGSPGHGHEVNKAKLFVEHLPLDVTRVGLIKMFQNFGTIAKAYLIKGKSRSNKVYGYVIFSNVASASQAMADMNGLRIGENKLRVSIAVDTYNAKENRSSSQPTHALPCPDHGHVRKNAYRAPEYEDEDLPGYRKMYRRQ